MTPNPTFPNAGTPLRVGTCQFPVSAEIGANSDWILRQMREAADLGAHVVHFPETALSGYAGVDHSSLGDFPWPEQSAQLGRILAAAAELGVWVILGAAHRLSGERRPHNSLYVIDPAAGVVDRYDKRFCTRQDLDNYSPGDHFVTFDLRGVRCGLLICYDIRFPELYRQYAKLGARLMFHSFYNARSTDGSIVGHEKIMPVILQANAANNGMFVSATNCSAAPSWPARFITPDGMVAAALGRDEPGVMVNEVDLAKPYYDASAPFRADAIAGRWHSGDLVSDARSTDRRCT